VPKQFSNCFTQQKKVRFCLPVIGEYPFLGFSQNLFIAG